MAWLPAQTLAWRSLVLTLAFAVVHAHGPLAARSAGVELSPKELIRERQVLYRIEPDAKGGEAYRLVYLVPAPLEVFWRFKTDFNNDFLLSHRFIREHRVISQHGNVVITEDTYTSAPGKVFRWKTTVDAAQHRLEFVLDNPVECNQRFHYGFIRLEPFGEAQTKVTHVAYFDFLGASLWANYPWPGGMSSFLRYTATWEQETILRLRERYSQKP
jgi:hypothetical protein